MSALIISSGVAIAAVVGAGSYALYQKQVNGTPVNATVEAAYHGVRQAAASTAAVVVPTLRNTGVRATMAQKLAWCRKVGRTQGPAGISEVDRVRTSPYINPQFQHDLHGFARFAGEGADVGLKGGTVLAVLLSIETWAGIAGHGDGACWNYNFGNSKLWQEQWRADVTRPCFFLVDRVPSLDYYPAFTTPAEGVRLWAETTFANPRYRQYGTMEALRAGDIRAFCKAIGRGGYARMYRNARAMDARARLMARMAPYNRFRGPAVIDGSQLLFNDSIT